MITTVTVVERGRVSPVSGVVQQQQQCCGFLMLALTREIARSDIQMSGGLSDRVSHEEEWVIVFGYTSLPMPLFLLPFYHPFKLFMI